MKNKKIKGNLCYLAARLLVDELRDQGYSVTVAMYYSCLGPRYTVEWR